MTETSSSLPMELHAWFMANMPDTRWGMSTAAKHSIMFMRDTLVQPFYVTYDAQNASLPQVISTHTSKSIVLPVVQFKYKGLKLTMRDNFYDWGFAVQSDVPLNFYDTNYIFKKDEVGSYREGFPVSLMLPPYLESDGKSFGASTGNDNSAWTFVWLVRRAYDEWFK